MILEYDLIVTLIIIISMIKDIHLLESFLVALDVLWRLLATRDDMSLDLSFAVLTHIIDFFVKF